MDRMILIAALCGLLFHVYVTKDLVGGPIKPPSYDGKTSWHYNYFIYLFIYLSIFSYHTYSVLTVLLSKFLRTSLILSRVKKYGGLLQATQNYKFGLLRVFCMENILRWCYTRGFATTTFSATQPCNVVATLFRIGTTLFHLCNAS